jgi:D-arabinose 1-dehydrogenase-like Zn-dependent alcohol dehydrogenase
VPGVALADGDVLVAVEMSTICGSDVHTVQGRRSAPTPLVLGHESVGRVIATGDAGAHTVDGTPLRIGDRVVWSVTVSCASCDRCLQGMPQKCRDLGKYGHDRVGAHGDLTGAFASHVQLREGTAIVRVPEALPAAVLAPASCATATAWAAVARAARRTATSMGRACGSTGLGWWGCPLQRSPPSRERGWRCSTPTRIGGRSQRDSVRRASTASPTW